MKRKFEVTFTGSTEVEAETALEAQRIVEQTKTINTNQRISVESGWDTLLKSTWRNIPAIFAGVLWMCAALSIFRAIQATASIEPNMRVLYLLGLLNVVLMLPFTMKWVSRFGRRWSDE